MIFFYHPLAGKKEIEITKEFYNSLIRARRKKINEYITVQNLQNNKQYIYEIINISKRIALLQLQEINNIVIKKQEPEIHLAWGICEAKTIYTTLPMLNQLNVQKIFFVHCERSQGNIFLSSEKIKNILISSCEQCGRNNLLEWEYIGFHEYLKQYPESLICDFGGKKFQQNEKYTNIFVGPEGGFSQKERHQFSQHKIRSFNTSFVLKSETACLAVCSQKIY